MLAAKQKRKENIAEYILYLYQVEDLIRAFKLDISDIETHLVSRYQVDDKTRQEISEWYKNLVTMMQKEGLRESGHFQFLTNLINELSEFHLKLMNDNIDPAYVAEFRTVSGLITELNLKGNTVKNDIQTSLDAVYGYLMLKIQKKEISEETTQAIKMLTAWLSYLSKLFKEYEAGDLDLS
jgi:hypothetical protein